MLLPQSVPANQPASLAPHFLGFPISPGPCSFPSHLCSSGKTSPPGTFTTTTAEAVAVTAAAEHQDLPMTASPRLDLATTWVLPCFSWALLVWDPVLLLASLNVLLAERVMAFKGMVLGQHNTQDPQWGLLFAPLATKKEEEKVRVNGLMECYVECCESYVVWSYCLNWMTGAEHPGQLRPSQKMEDPPVNERNIILLLFLELTSIWRRGSWRQKLVEMCPRCVSFKAQVPKMSHFANNL